MVRAAAAYESRDARFRVPGKDFDRQYAQLYFYRLQQMRAHVEAAARRAWPGVQGARGGRGGAPSVGRRLALAVLDPAAAARRRPAPLFHSNSNPLRRPLPPPSGSPAVVRILGVPEEGEVAIVGTLYKEMKLKVGGGVGGCGCGVAVGRRVPTGRLMRARRTAALARACLAASAALPPVPASLSVPAFPVLYCPLVPPLAPPRSPPSWTSTSRTTRSASSWAARASRSPRTGACRPAWHSWLGGGTRLGPEGAWQACPCFPTPAPSVLPHPPTHPPRPRLVLEDEGARVALCGDALPVGECVTGVVAAVCGRVTPAGDFECSAICFAGLPPQAPLPAAEEK